MKKLVYIVILIPFLFLVPLYILWGQAAWKVISTPYPSNYIDSHNIPGYELLSPIIMFMPIPTLVSLILYLAIKAYEVYKRQLTLKLFDIIGIIVFIIVIANVFSGNGLTTLNPFEALDWFLD